MFMRAKKTISLVINVGNSFLDLRIYDCIRLWSTTIQPQATMIALYVVQGLKISKHTCCSMKKENLSVKYAAKSSRKGQGLQFMKELTVGKNLSNVTSVTWHTYPKPPCTTMSNMSMTMSHMPKNPSHYEQSVVLRPIIYVSDSLDMTRIIISENNISA